MIRIYVITSLAIFATGPASSSNSAHSDLYGPLAAVIQTGAGYRRRQHTPANPLAEILQKLRRRPFRGSGRRASVPERDAASCQPERRISQSSHPTPRTHRRSPADAATIRHPVAENRLDQPHAAASGRATRPRPRGKRQPYWSEYTYRRSLGLCYCDDGALSHYLTSQSNPYGTFPAWS
jgi:hypothetical protein